MKLKYLCLIFFITSCGGGGSSAVLVPDIEPPTNSYQATTCLNYDGPTDKIIWIDDFLELSYLDNCCLLYTSPSPRDSCASRMPSSA